MVSELYRSYAAVASGAGNSSQGMQSGTPINQTPVTPINQTSIQGTPEGTPQRNLQRQRNRDSEENPLFIGVNDNPCTILVSPPLTGSSNYNTWCISMRIALEVKNKWSLIDGSIASPIRDQPQYNTWRLCNLIVCSWLFKSVDPSIAQSVMHIDKAKDIWDDLKRRFSQQDAQRISLLQDEIHGLKQGSLSINEYYTKSRTLWEQMNTLRPLPICKWNPRCACGLVDEIRKERETDQVIRFLKGMNEEYSSLKSNVLVLDPLPEVYKIFVMAEKLEMHISLNNLSLGSLDVIHSNVVQNTAIGNNNDEIVTAFNNHNGKRNNMMKAKCTYCGMSGHTVDKCYKKHGYPPGWIQGFKSKGKQQSNMNAAVTNDTENPGATSEQLQKILSILQPSQQVGASNTTAVVSLTPKFDESSSIEEGKSPITLVNSFALCSSTWILDSGATNHIVYSLDFLVNYQKANGAKVNLPTGQRIAVENIGDVKLSHNLRLRNALHIPTFQFNIISVSKLIQDSSYKLIFLPGQRLIQESLGTIAGIAKEDRGLYLLETTRPPAKVSVVQQADPDVWHQRLGHFPVNKLHLFSNIDISHNDFSRYTWLHMMKAKSETRQFLKKFHAYVFTQFDRLIKVLRSDNGTEFKMEEFLSDNGIIHQKSCVNTPQQNAKVERKHQHILSVARSLRF
ncbi:PREDICTED: uncharacterized protein LOC109157415 [Ipomoea nil]|uniref:uncharacterized protein LOC109157415 n=1 Tax=Ipomoea nil TaxID=35883 RepID=UPI000901A69C|nr:PREDICTED: uncharacterized protein LOC109157415 [Ipomoea nil]